ncbi:MAG: hypothetical protein ACRDZ8_15260 [Acidimicrobiales bacterium]
MKGARATWQSREKTIDGRNCDREEGATVNRQANTGAHRTNRRRHHGAPLRPSKILVREMRDLVRHHGPQLPVVDSVEEGTRQH